MPFPRYVTVKLTHGRSIPVSVEGKMVRLRKDSGEMPIPWQVYRRFAHKLELVGDSIGQVNAAMQEGDVQTAAPSVMIPGGWAGSTSESGGEGEEPPKPVKETLPEWPLPTPPEEYVKLFGKRKNPSKTIKGRLDLAAKIMAAGGTDG